MKSYFFYAKFYYSDGRVSHVNGVAQINKNQVGKGVIRAVSESILSDCEDLKKEDGKLIVMSLSRV